MTTGLRGTHLDTATRKTAAMSPQDAPAEARAGNARLVAGRSPCFSNQQQSFNSNQHNHHEPSTRY
jgi:hypothetical protein